MFENIIGHENIKKLFEDENYVLRNTYIMSGVDGIGKKMMALEIANKIAQYPQNILLIQSDKALGVDDIRPISDFIYRFPFGKDNKRVVIIDNCHTMNNVCQNMLLKLLEEPPEFAVFFLITSDVTSLLDTILSRANVLRFNGISVDDIRGMLSEKIKDTGLLSFISVVIDGAISVAVNIDDKLDYFKQLYSCCNDIVKLNKEENIFDLVTKLNDIIKHPNEWQYIYRWFAYNARMISDVTNLADNRYYQYATIVGNTISTMNKSGDNTLPIDVMLIKICKYNKRK